MLGFTLVEIMYRSSNVNHLLTYRNKTRSTNTMFVLFRLDL